MRKFKVGDVYSADCFNDRDEKIDRKGGYWHFKIIEVVRGYHDGKAYNLYIGIKVDMRDYQSPSTDYLVESFNSDGVSTYGVDNYFKLKRNITKKRGMKITQGRNLYFWNLPKEFKKEEPQIDDIELHPLAMPHFCKSLDEYSAKCKELEKATDGIKANPLQAFIISN